MKLLGVALTGALVSAVALAAFADERVLTLEQALEMARKRNRNLVVERARLAQVRTNVEQAWAALFPRVAAEGRYSRNYKHVELAFGPGGTLVVQPANQLD